MISALMSMYIDRHILLIYTRNYVTAFQELHWILLSEPWQKSMAIWIMTTHFYSTCCNVTVISRIYLHNFFMWGFTSICLSSRGSLARVLARPVTILPDNNTIYKWSYKVNIDETNSYVNKYKTMNINILYLYYINILCLSPNFPITTQHTNG